MAATEDISTTRMPRALLTLAVALFFARAGIDTLSPSRADTPVSTIAWLNIEDRAVAADGNRQLRLYEFCADWSAPCKKMEATVLGNRQIAGLVRENFVPIKVTDRQKEAGKNPRNIAELEKRFHVFAFPTLVVTTPDGEVVSTLVGNGSALSTFQFLTRALHANPPG